MSYENTGGRILICPTDETFSEIAPSTFSLYQFDASPEAGSYAILKPISDEIVGTWLSNVRRLKIDFAISSFPEFDLTETISQWKLDNSFNPIERNLDDHPNPINYFGGGGIGRFLKAYPKDYFKDDGTSGELDYNFPFIIFRHLGSWYMYLPLTSAKPAVTITTDYMEVVYTFSDGGTWTFTHSILDKFYP